MRVEIGLAKRQKGGGVWEPYRAMAPKSSNRSTDGSYIGAVRAMTGGKLQEGGLGGSNSTEESTEVKHYEVRGRAFTSRKAAANGTEQYVLQACPHPPRWGTAKDIVL